MKLGDLIREYRESHGFSQRQFANLCDLSNGYISILEKGLNPNTGKPVIPALPQLKKLADGMGITIDDLFNQIDEMDIYVSKNILPMPPMKRWKVLGATACGDAVHIEFEDETVLAPADIDADYVFRCVGDSMVGAHIFEGDLVFIKHGEEVLDGQIGIVRVGDEYMLKRIYHGLDYLELRSENPAYPPKIIRGEQENAEIVGRAVKFLTRVV